LVDEEDGGCGSGSGSGGLAAAAVFFVHQCFFFGVSGGGGSVFSVFSAAGGSGLGCVSTTPSTCIGPSETSCASIPSGRPPEGTSTRVEKGLYPSARTSIRCEPAATVWTKGGSGPDGWPSMNSSDDTDGDGVTTIFPGRTSS